MKNIILISCLALLSFALKSCEQTVTGVQLPYVEQLVVRCVIEEGKNIYKVRVERTLPPLEYYTEQKALVNNAIVVISDGNISDTLQYDDGYYHSDKLIVEAGKTYTLNAYWKNKKATSKTTMPQKPQIDSIFYKVRTYSDYGFQTYLLEVFAEITPQPSAVYQAGLHFKEQNYGFMDDFVYRYSDRNNSGKILVNFGGFMFDRMPSQNDIDTRLSSLMFIVRAYDLPYYDYYLTKWNGESTDAIFGTSGNNVMWNVKGDGIGMFLAQSDLMLKYK